MGYGDMTTFFFFLSNYETMSDKQFEEVNLQGSITDQFED